MTKACQLFLVPSRSSNPPLYPSKGCELRSVLRLLLFRCFLLGLTFESLEELGVRQHVFNFQSIFHSTSVKVTKQFSHIHKLSFNCYTKTFMSLTIIESIMVSMYLLSSMPHVADNRYNPNIIHKISILSPKYG